MVVLEEWRSSEVVVVEYYVVLPVLVFFLLKHLKKTIVDFHN